ncbi:lipoyl protein ligase domain-containing protein [Thioclava atlantica]|uniref:Putative lipoate-protein ligase n=1 Tax=Thioclava atlantica TaxID=1317124 RepID=A0A085TUY7_9RHOB|nr:hypothetical protein [Thioclava atlantica]KFE34534.1 putative lipoate-protein ligase [Thioclava atlantica]
MTVLDVATALRRFASAAEGIDAERGLLQAARAGGRGALIWMADRPALVAPSAFSRLPGFERSSAMSAARGWPFHLRPTGGGVTPQGPGIVNLALTGPADGLTTDAAYRGLCDIISAALVELGIASEPGPLAGSFCDGEWNLLCGGRKIAGTAQRWAPRPSPNRGWVFLAHAAILDEVPLAAPLAAIDALHCELNLPVTSGPSAHTTVALEREAGRGASLGEALAGAISGTA